MRVMMVVMCALAFGLGPAGAERLRSPDGKIVKEVPSESVAFALKDGWRRVPKVMMRAPPDGRATPIDEDYADEYERRGWWRMTQEEARTYLRAQQDAADAEAQRVAKIERDRIENREMVRAERIRRESEPSGLTTPETTEIATAVVAGLTLLMIGAAVVYSFKRRA